MAGLGVSTPPAPAPAPGPAPMGHNGGPPMDDMDLDGGEPASPEEQAIYNKFVGMGMMALYADAFIEQFKPMLQAGAIDAIAESVAAIAVKVMEVAAKEQAPIPVEVVVPAMMELVEQAGELCEDLGVQVSDAELEQAYYHALDRGRSQAQQAGLLDMTESVQGLQQAQADGRLDQMVGALTGGGGQPPGPAANLPAPPMQGAA